MRMLPVIRGLIERRILVNYRVDPEVLRRLLPAPFRPKLIHGMGVAGICLIRLARVRPRGLPGWLGISSENAAHRVAVEWDEAGVPQSGVYIRRRDTDCRLNALAGGRIFPGFHSLADFDVHETGDRWRVALASRDRETRITVDARLADRPPAGSMFGSLEEASQFFQTGALGYSATPDWRVFQGLELRSFQWKLEPLAIESVASSYFDDSTVFPPGSLELDSAFLMRQIEHEWHERSELRSEPAETSLAASERPILPGVWRAG